MLPYTLQPPPRSHPLPLFSRGRSSDSVCTLAQNMSVLALVTLDTCRREIRCTSLTKCWAGSEFFSFEVARRKRGGGAEHPRRLVSNPDDEIEIFRAFVFLPYRFDPRLINIVTSSVHHGHQKLNRFAARRSAVALRRKRGGSRVPQLPRERGRRKCACIGGRDIGARIYAWTCIQLGNIISRRITTGLVIVARVARFSSRYRR